MGWGWDIHFLDNKSERVEYEAEKAKKQMLCYWGHSFSGKVGFLVLCDIFQEQYKATVLKTVA